MGNWQMMDEENGYTTSWDKKEEPKTEKEPDESETEDE